MATKIKVKRKKSTGNNDVQLNAGEPYYNLKDKHLYVGNSDGEFVVDKKHIAEVTNIPKDDSNHVCFQIGEDVENVIDLNLGEITTFETDLSNLQSELKNTMNTNYSELKGRIISLSNTLDTKTSWKTFPVKK